VVKKRKKTGGRDFKKGQKGLGNEKGVTGNLNGRPKGVPNKTTGLVKQIIADIFEQHKETICEDILSLKPKERLEFFAALLPYVISKRDQSSNRVSAQPIRVIGVTQEELDDLLIEEVEVIEDDED